MAMSAGVKAAAGVMAENSASGGGMAEEISSAYQWQLKVASK